MITRSATTEAELGGLIDGVNALIIQLHQTLCLRGAGSTADVNADDTVLLVVAMLLPIVVWAVLLIMVVVLKWNNFYNNKASEKSEALLCV